MTAALTPSTLRALAICTATVAHFGLSLSTLCSHEPGSRERTPVRARHIALYLMRTRLSMSYPEIGRMVARDHTTAMHGVERIKRALALAHLARVEMPACVPDVVIVLDAPDAVLDARIAAREREGRASAADVATWRGEMRRVYRESQLTWMRFGVAWRRARQKAGDSARDIIVARREWMMTRFFTVDTSGSAQETEQRLREVVGEVVNG